MSRSHAETLLMESNLLLCNYIGARSVAIACISEGTPRDVGSGTCVMIGGRYLIATAAHVLRGYPLEDVFLIHRRAGTNAFTPIVQMELRGGGDYDYEDWAFLELAQDVARALEKEFVPVENIECNVQHASGDLAVAFGYPTELIDLNAFRQQQLAVQPICYMSPTIDPIEWPQNVPLEHDRDIAVEYPRDGNVWSWGANRRLPHARGMSGGGIWRTNINADGIWRAEMCRLIGITCGFFNTRQIVQGIMIQHWLSMVA